MTEPLKAHELPIRKIFSPDFTFRIPSYQRPYAWTIEEVHELLNDLLDSLDEVGPKTKMEDVRPYFLGSIVLVKDSGRPEADVVDGQQRLTTLTMLLAALRDASDQPATRSAIQELIYQKGNPVTGDRDRFRLTLRPRDIDYFRKAIQEEEGTAYLKDDPGDLTDSQQNIRLNGLELVRQIGELPAAQRDRLAAFVIQRCYLVVVSAIDRDAAYRIFRVMNDRGLDLSATDILKAEIIGQFQDRPAEEKKYTEIWEDLEDEMGRNAFEMLFGHIRMIFVKQKAKQSLISEFREGVLKTSNGEKFINETLLPYSNAYEQVIDSDCVGAAHAAEINRYLVYLNRLDNADWIPPAMAFIAKNKANPAAVLKFICSLERLAYGLFIRREYPTDRISRYGTLLQWMADGKDLYVPGSPLDLSEQERKEALDQLEGPLYEVRRIRQQVLLRLDELVSDGGATYDFNVITVEHVLPQNPRADSEWINLFPDPEERAAWVHKIGNLALLPFRKNSQAGALDFAKKVQVYFKKGKAVSFALTTQIVNEPTWTPDTVKVRHRRLVDLLAQEWRLVAD